MIHSRVEKIFLNIIKAGVVIILFLPLLIYRPVLFPYVFNKIIVFQILIEIIFAAWLFLTISGKKYRPDWKNPLLMSLTLFMGILILTALAGVDFSKSFWSTQERMTGVLTMLHFFIFFIVLISVFKQWKDWKLFIYTSLICSFLVGLYGIGQKIGLTILLKQEGLRMSATLGNPIFLAVYSMLHIFFSGFLLVQINKNTKRKIILWALIIFYLSIMVFTGSRGAVIAFGFSAFLFLIFLIALYTHGRTRKILGVTVGLLIILLIAGFIFTKTPKGVVLVNNTPYPIQRIINITRGSEQRIMAWTIGINGFKQKPFLGWGQENFNIVWNKHYQPYFLRLGDEATWFDRSHNQLIDLLALTGIFGILSYLIIFGALFWLLFRKIKILDKEVPPQKEEQPRMGYIILGLMFVAYFVQNLFVFDTPVPLIIFYFSLALVYFITRSNEQPLIDTEQSSTVNRFPLPVLIFLIIIFLPWMIYKFNIEPFQQSRLGIRAVHTSKVELKSGLYWYQQALEKNTFTNPEIRTQLAKTVAQQYETKNSDLQTVVEMTEFAITEFKKSVKEHPLDARHYLYLGQLYNLATRYNPGYIKEAENILIKALELSPQRQQIYFELARIHLFKNEYQQGIDLLKQAVALDPQVKISINNLKKFLKTLGEKELEPELVSNTQQWLKQLRENLK